MKDRMLELASGSIESLSKFPAMLTRDFRGHNATLNADHVLLFGTALACGFSDESPTCSASRQSSDEVMKGRV